MSATDLNVDFRDLRFVLFEQLRVTEQLSRFEAFADFDDELYASMIEEAIRISKDTLYPANRVGDAEGVEFDGQGNVSTSPGFKECWDVIAEGGWLGLAAPPEFGGTGLPVVVGGCVGEIFTAANAALATYTGLTRGAANVLRKYAPESIRQETVEKLFSGQWAGTMCLTEAGAGSAVGDNRARAERTDEDGVYLLTGEKVFITAGDHDLTENIIHLVLARTPDAPSGTRGLSIFAVPKFDYDTGARNDAVVVGVEEKMGIHASATCTLALGANGPCRGYILGGEGEGMPIMFHMMNEARIGVGMQGLASAAASYLNALSYAKERIQGASVKNFKDPDAERVAIVEHPDVRRMLMTMKVAVETMRSVLYTTALRFDLAHNEPEGETAERYKALVELLTPVCKAHCTNLGFEVTRLAIQTFGGYGYIKEYPVEQHMRDNRIASLYEGTNGIQAMDLLGRKMRTGGGKYFMQWLQQAGEDIEAARSTGAFDDEIVALEKARDGLGATAMHLGGLAGGGNLDGAMLQATPFLELFGTVVLGTHALEQARVAHEALAAGAAAEDEAFYKGKILNLRFYVSTFLPKAIALSKTIRAADESCLDAALFQ